MVEITNIKRDGDFISCNYHPEGKDVSGFIKVSISKNKTVEHKEAPWDCCLSTYASMARVCLMDIKDKVPYRDKYEAYWY